MRVVGAEIASGLVRRGGRGGGGLPGGKNRQHQDENQGPPRTWWEVHRGYGGDPGPGVHEPEDRRPAINRKPASQSAGRASIRAKRIKGEVLLARTDRDHGWNAGGAIGLAPSKRHMASATWTLSATATGRSFPRAARKESISWKHTPRIDPGHQVPAFVRVTGSGGTADGCAPLCHYRRRRWNDRPGRCHGAGHRGGVPSRRVRR